MWAGISSLDAMEERILFPRKGRQMRETLQDKGKKGRKNSCLKENFFENGKRDKTILVKNVSINQTYINVMII